LWLSGDEVGQVLRIWSSRNLLRWLACENRRGVPVGEEKRILHCRAQLDRRLPQDCVFEEQAGCERWSSGLESGIDRHLGGIKIEADDPIPSAGALPITKFMAGRHEGKLATENT
jgi:hypothetical protein